MRLDAHQHFWAYDPVQYPWIPIGSPLHRDWLPEDLATIQAPLGFDGSIAVQARQSLEESRWLLKLADRSPGIQGVVGWVDLRNPEVDHALTELAAHPKFVGVRHVVQDEPNDRFLLEPEFIRGLKQLAKFDLTYDLLIYPRQLPAAIELLERLPEQSFVLDHLAKPEIKAGKFEPWAEQIRQLARSANVSCKLSGLLTEADHQHWKAEDFKPYLDLAFECFGPERLMFGSDWPVCLLAGNYSQVLDLMDSYLQQFPAPIQQAVLGTNAWNFYFGR